MYVHPDSRDLATNRGLFPIGDPPNDSPQMAIALDWYDLDRRRDLNRLFAQDASLRETGRSLEGQFHTQDIFSGLYMFLTVSPKNLQRLFIV